MDREWRAYPCLEHAPLGVNASPTFLFLHTEGVHEPVWLDREGKRLSAKDDSYPGHVEMGVFVLRHLGKLFDAFREKGVYDNSCILVLGDHGNRIGGDGNGLPGLARPFLWVKPFGETRPFTTDSAPTSHARIADFLRAEAKSELDGPKIAAILSADLRRFRETNGNLRKDWLVAGDGSFNVEEGFLQTPTPEELPPLRLGHRYSFDMSRPSAKDTEAFLFTRLPIHPYPTWWPAVRDIGIAFKVQDPLARYTVELGVHMWCPECENAGAGDAVAVLHLAENQTGRQEPVLHEVLHEGDARVVMGGIAPHPDGMIAIEGERLGDSPIKIQLRSMRVTPEK